MKYRAIFDTENWAKKIASAVGSKCKCDVSPILGGWCVAFEVESVADDSKTALEALGFKEVQENVMTPDERLFMATTELRMAQRRLEIAEKEYEEAMNAVKNQDKES